MSSRPTALTVAIRRDILSALATSEGVTVPAATAQVAANWSARRRRRGESPSAVHSAATIVFQVGAELGDDVAALQARHDAAVTPSRVRRRGPTRSPAAPAIPVCSPSGREALHALPSGDRRGTSPARTCG